MRLVGEIGKITLSPLKKEIPGTKVLVPCEFISTLQAPIDLDTLSQLQRQTVVVTIQPRQMEMKLEEEDTDHS
jgi:hypothetical protein